MMPLGYCLLGGAGLYQADEFLVDDRVATAGLVGRLLLGTFGTLSSGRMDSPILKGPST